MRIDKEIGPESGLITFREVSFLSIHQRFPGDAIEGTPVSELPEKFWSRYPVYTDCLEPDDVAFQIYDQEGPVHLVVAKSVSYEFLAATAKEIS